MNIETQTIPDGADVVLPVNGGSGITVNGIGYNNVDTFTILTAGLYYACAALNFAAGTAANSAFAFLINGVGVASPAANADTVGPITLFRVAFYNVGDTISLRNFSNGNPVSIINGIALGLGSAGHLTIFRFADGSMV